MKRWAILGLVLVAGCGSSASSDWGMRDAERTTDWSYGWEVGGALSHTTSCDKKDERYYICTAHDGSNSYVFKIVDYKGKPQSWLIKVCANYTDYCETTEKLMGD